MQKEKGQKGRTHAIWPHSEYEATVEFIFYKSNFPSRLRMQLLARQHGEVTVQLPVNKKWSMISYQETHLSKSCNRSMPSKQCQSG